jgi:cyclohexa-1,5-dienecarbonyl-CoA hydratase
MSYQYIQSELKDGVATIILNRQPVNVLNIAMMEEINEVLTNLQKENVNLLVFKAAGKAFSAGVEVAEHMGGLAEKMIEVFHGMFRGMDKLAVPSIAVVNGVALGGGCELAIYCDMAISSDKAKFGQPEIKVGVFPSIATLIMPRVMGRKKAMEMLLSGETFGAEEAMTLGLINKVVPHDRLEAEAEKFIGKFTGNSGIVSKWTKAAALAGIQDAQAQVLTTIEDIYMNKLMKTHDAQEGLQAFVDKKTPVWKNC